MIARGRGPIATARRGKPIPMCWYCGSYTGHIVTQPDGNLLHELCLELEALEKKHAVTINEKGNLMAVVMQLRQTLEKILDAANDPISTTCPYIKQIAATTLKDGD